MLVNHVLSSNLPSNIFTALLEYARKYAPDTWQVKVSTRPIKHADIYHYHRPQLERSLLQPAVVTVHHDLSDANPAHSFAHFMARYREAARVICLNDAQATLLRAEGLQQLVTIPHGYNDEVLSLRKPDTFGAERARIGFFSNRYRTRFKGEAYLGELAKRLSPERFEFVLVGEGRAATAQELEQLGYRVKLYEHMPYRLFQALYESIDYLLMCSNFEGGPANLPEALATGTPVLASAVGFVEAFVQDGVNGLLIGRDVDADAQRIAGLAAPRAPLAVSLRNGSAARAATTPTWRAVVARQFAVYEAVLSGGDHA